MTDPAKRTERWLAKYDIERVKSTLTALKGGMGERYKASTEPYCEIETQVREVINGLGVPTPQYVPYLNFGRQLYKLSRQRGIAGESFAMAAQVFLVKWTACGCDPKVLAKIRTGVFNVSEPSH